MFHVYAALIKISPINYANRATFFLPCDKWLHCTAQLSWNKNKHQPAIASLDVQYGTEVRLLEIIMQIKLLIANS
jgi:hypothetical protein